MPEGGQRSLATHAAGGIVPGGTPSVRPWGDALERDVAAWCEHRPGRRANTTTLWIGGTLACYPADLVDFGVGLLASITGRNDGTRDAE